MDMGVHQPGREKFAGQGVAFKGVAAATARVDAGNHVADDTHVGFTNFTGRHIDDVSIGEQQVERNFTTSGLNGAAAVFSMILPAMRQNEGGWLIVTLGFMLGAAMIAGVDALMCRVQRIQNASDSARKRLMMVAAITLHNIPEGMAVGVVYAGYLSGQAQITAAGALALSLGIAIQNFPEGAIISMPLHAEGMGKGRAFADGVLSGMTAQDFNDMMAQATTIQPIQ